MGFPSRASEQPVDRGKNIDRYSTRLIADSDEPKTGLERGLREKNAAY